MSGEIMDEWGDNGLLGTSGEIKDFWGRVGR